MIQTELKVAKKPGYHAVVLRASHQDWVQLMRDRTDSAHCKGRESMREWVSECESRV